MFLNETVPRTHARNTVARCLSLSGSAKLLVQFSSSCAHELLARSSVSIILSELFFKLSFSVFVYFFPLHSSVYYRLPLVPHQHCPSCFCVSWGVEKVCVKCMNSLWGYCTLIPSHRHVAHYIFLFEFHAKSWINFIRYPTVLHSLA